MATVHNRSQALKQFGVASTLIDAALEFVKGRPKSGLLLLGAAAISTRLSGFGTAISVILRLYRRFR